MRAVKKQDYKVMVHKGFGLDKMLCGKKRAGDFRAGENRFSDLESKQPEFALAFFFKFKDQS